MTIELASARIRSSKGLAIDLRVAESTGLEPATSAVTGRRSNQLSYNSSEKVVKLELNLGGFNRKFLSYAPFREYRLLDPTQG